MSDNKKEQLKHKLRRLKAIAECPTANPNEAAAAAAMMARLMVEYQVAAAELEVEELGYISDVQILDVQFFRDPLNNKTPHWHLVLAHAIAKHTACECYTLKSLNDTLRIIGIALDIDNARRMYVFLVTELTRLAYMWTPEDGSRVTPRMRKDFLEGAVIGVRQSLEEEKLRESQTIQNSTQGLQLYDMKKRALKDKATELGLRPGKSRGSSSRSYDADAYANGMRAGKAIKVKQDTSFKQSAPSTDILTYQRERGKNFKCHISKYP